MFSIQCTWKQDFNDWRNKRAVVRLLNSGYFIEIPQGQGWDSLDGVKVENGSDRPILICIEEVK